jgi:hypothetical protein
VNVSACQREDGVSCGACCGIFNLNFREVSETEGESTGGSEARARAELLAERTRAFAQVRFDRAADFVAYRQSREALEKRIPRHNPEIYVCPFYGTIDEGGRAGCLAHPARTGLAHTQNFSFYGASICQAYDCRNKDRDETQFYSRLIARWFGGARAPGVPASEEYARLMADIPLYAFLERFDGLIEILFECRDAGESPLREFLRLARLRLAAPQSRRITSFEVEMKRHPDSVAELRSLLDSPREASAIVEQLRRALQRPSTPGRETLC